MSLILAVFHYFSSSSSASCMKSAGISFVIPRGYQSNCQVDTQVCTSIKNAYSAGISKRDTYMFPSPTCSKSASSQMSELVSYLKVLLLKNFTRMKLLILLNCVYRATVLLSGAAESGWISKDLHIGPATLRTTRVSTRHLSTHARPTELFAESTPQLRSGRQSSGAPRTATAATCLCGMLTTTTTLPSRTSPRSAAGLPLMPSNTRGPLLCAVWEWTKTIRLVFNLFMMLVLTLS